MALKAGVVELLDHLDEAGLPRAVATSSSHMAVQHQLGRNGLIERFQAVVAAGDYARGKPNPDPFLTAAERLTIMVPDLLAATDEMRERCITIAESLHDVRAILTAPARRASAG